MTITVEAFESEVASRLEQARDRVRRRAAEIKAELAAMGALNSGATIRRLIAAGGGIEREVTALILADLDTARDRAGPRRAASMRQCIEPALQAFHGELRELTGLDNHLAFGGRAATAAGGALLDEAWSNVRADLDRYDRGFSGAQPKGWSERHPIRWKLIEIAITGLLGALLGVGGTLAVQALSGR